MHVYDLAPQSQWQTLLDGVHERTGMTATLYNQEGAVVLRQGSWANALCPLVQDKASARTAVCAVVQQALGRQAVATREAQVDECDLGMIKFVVPVLDSDQVVGFIGACGGRDPDTEVETFLAAKVLETSEEAIAEAVAGVPAVAPDTIEGVLDYLGLELDRLGR